METLRQLSIVPQWIVRAFVSMPEELAYRYGITLTEIRLTRQEDGWRMMVKGDGSNGPLVAYSSAQHFSDCVEFISYEVENSTLSFRADKYPVKYRDGGQSP